MITKTNRAVYGAVASAVLLLAIVLVSSPVVTFASVLNRSLGLESTGSDVSALQTFLAQDSTLYPRGLVTGYYGFLTKAAVSNFQTRNGIDAVGVVGPITLPVLNIQMANGMVNNSGSGSTNPFANLASMIAPKIMSINTYASRNSASVSWNTDEASKGVVYYSTTQLSLTENVNSVNVSGNAVMTSSNYLNSQSISLPNLSANTTYYFSVYSTDQGGNSSISWPTTFQTTN